jgi:hypothetical protein
MVSACPTSSVWISSGLMGRTWVHVRPDALYGPGLLERRASATSTTTPYGVDITPGNLALQRYDRCNPARR